MISVSKKLYETLSGTASCQLRAKQNQIGANLRTIRTAEPASDQVRRSAECDRLSAGGWRSHARYSPVKGGDRLQQYPRPEERQEVTWIVQWCFGGTSCIWLGGVLCWVEPPSGCWKVLARRSPPEHRYKFKRLIKSWVST